MASESHGATQQDHELSDLQMYCYERPRRIKTKKSYKEFASDEENSEMGITMDETRKRKIKGSKRKESPLHLALEKKQRQLTDTLRWLGENYELKEGMCLPRCVMYTHYLDFCKKEKLCPSGPATFGKVIRQKFPKLTTRRLGTRGQSKYHYYGIRVKETSQYFHAGYSKQGLTRFSTMKTKGEGSVKKFALNSKARTLLPEFPNAKRLNLPKGVSQQKVETFIMMYRTHCQRLLDTVISANFDGIHNFILHFWQGMPGHMTSVLQSTIVVDVIAICDSILYKVLIDVLIPSSIQDLPDSLREEIREFASNLQIWLKDSLSEVPKTVKEVKLKVAQTFGRALTRQVSFVHLAQTARSVLLSYDSVSRMISDLRRIDFSLIMNQTMFLLGDAEDVPTLTKTFVQEFEGLLSKQAPLEAYTEWLDSVVDRCVLKDLNDDQEDEIFEGRATKFLGTWSFITSKMLEDLTLRSAPSFGVFHLIHATFQEYVLLIIENQKMLEVDKKLQKALQSHFKEDFMTDSIDQWMDVKHAEYEVRAAESLETKAVESSGVYECSDKTTSRNNNNNNIINNNIIINNNNSNTNGNTNSNNTLTKKNKTSSRIKESEVTKAPVKPVPRPIVMGTPHVPVSSPAVVPRPISIVPTSITVVSSSAEATIAKHTYSPHQLQSSAVNNTMTERQARNVQQYLYTDDMVRNPTQGSDMTGPFHGPDFINAFDKSMFNPNLSISNAEFLTNPWFQPDNQSLAVLNNVSYTDPNIPSAENLDMSYHRSGEFGFGYANEFGISTSGIHPVEHQSPMSHRSDISYNQQGKDMDYSNYQNVLSRYNSMYYESMRSSGQTINSDIINYNGILSTPSNTMDIEGILAHEAQINRLGVGAV